MRHVLFAVFVVFAVLGCHHEQPAPVAAPVAAPASAGEAVDEGIKMLASASTALSGATDCGARATALEAWSHDHQDLMSKVRADLHKWPQDDVTSAVQERMPKHTETRPIFEAAAACSENAAFAATWKQMSDALQ